MHKYILGNKLGSGTYGSVRAAYNKESGDRVAIKTLRDACPSMKHLASMPEIQALRALSHPNIVQCKECILESNTVHIVFELMPDGDLESLARSSHWSSLTEDHYAEIARQILSAVAYIHASGFLHRDIKPENILVLFHPTSRSTKSAPVVKLGDLGLARKIRASEGKRPLTSYVATRWYRAPEQLLKMPSYGSAADMWAVGATLAELLNGGKPLFPGRDESDQLAKIFLARGHPAVVGWREGARAAIRYSDILPRTTSSCLPLRDVSPPLTQLVEDLLNINPQSRPSALEALHYPFNELLRESNFEKSETLSELPSVRTTPGDSGSFIQLGNTRNGTATTPLESYQTVTQRTESGLYPPRCVPCDRKVDEYKSSRERDPKDAARLESRSFAMRRPEKVRFRIPQIAPTVTAEVPESPQYPQAGPKARDIAYAHKNDRILRNRAGVFSIKSASSSLPMHHGFPPDNMLRRGQGVYPSEWL